MVLIDHKHECFQLLLRLESLLSSFALFLCFFLQNGELGLVTVLFFIHFYFGRDEVCLDALDHVLVLALLHLLEVGGFLYFIHLCLGVFDAVLLPVNFVFYVVLLVLLALQSSLDLVQLLLFGFNLASHEIVLLAKLAHGDRNFFDLFAAAFPAGDHIVWLQKCGRGHELRLLFVLSFPAVVNQTYLYL